MSHEKRRHASDEVFDRFRLIYDAASRGEMEVYVESLHDDVELHQSADIPGTRGTFRGKQGALELIDELSESFDEIDWNPKRVYDLGGERYLVLLFPKGRGTGSGIELEAEVGHLIQLRDGKTIRVDTYVGWDNALEAAGLSE